MYKKPLERFWSNIKISKPSECWEWYKPTSHPYGYARFRYQGHQYYAHRLAYILSTGEIPVGLFIMHTCDNPKCCNPNHLKAGTHSENMQDMIRKGRRVYKISNYMKGEDHYNAKLNNEKVLRIRKLYLQGWKQVDIAKEFRIRARLVNKIVHRQLWKNI